jgi:hypothetical protein
MRPTHLPRVAGLVVVLVAVAALAAAPRKDDPKKDNPTGSNLKGKIEDTRWSSFAQTVKGQKLPAGILKLEFGKDGSLKYVAGPSTFTGTYELKAGDTVMLHLTEPLAGRKDHEQTVVVAGDKMTVTDKDGTAAEFERVP